MTRNNLEIESVKTFEIWGRKLEINVVFDCFPGEEISKMQEAAYDDFMFHTSEYLEIALLEAKRYCVNHSDGRVNLPIDNIFKYVMPYSIYLKRSREGKKLFSLMCRYKFDMENGLTINFEDGKLKSSGPEQSIL